MDTSTPPTPQAVPETPLTGAQRLVVWQAAQKQLQGKLDPQALGTMRDEWPPVPRPERS
jgi:hypothetical protein